MSNKLFTFEGVLPIQDGDLRYYPDFISCKDSILLFEALKNEIDWREESIVLFGKKHLQPRLVAWYGDEGKSYRYSGKTYHPQPWNPTLLSIKKLVEEKADCSFNSCLLNLYRSGADSMGWHSDDEPELGENPVIASLSLGQSRVFKIRHKHNASLQKSIELHSGSLLIMAGEMQHFWKHAIPKSKNVSEARINLTFRKIVGR